MERIQLDLWGEMDFITGVTSELKDRKNFSGQNLLVPHVKDFITTVFELKFKLKKKKIKGNCWLHGTSGMSIILLNF